MLKVKKGHKNYADEVVAIILMAVAVVISLCLISHNENDPSVITSSSQPVKNWIGVVGANVSAILISAFGLVAYVLPFLLAIFSIQIFRSQAVLFEFGKLFSLVTFLFSASGLVSILGGYGAIVGAFVAKIAFYLGKVGSIILLSLLIVVSFVVITGVSFSFLLEGFTVAFNSLFEKLKRFFSDYRQWRFERRKQVKIRRQPQTIDKPERVDDEPLIRRIDEPVEEIQMPAIISNHLEEKQERDVSSRRVTTQSFEDYVFPPTDFLTAPLFYSEQKDEELLAMAEKIMEKVKEFNVTGRVVNICQGPVVTTYEFKPDPGVKYSKIVSLADDLCLALKAESIRIDRIPGKAYVGIEVPNTKRETIHLREIIESKKFRESESLLTIALGKTIDGANYVTDLAKMPHLLIAGATGSGKSVGVNALIVSILYKARPDEVKFIMVDPKRLELGVYADIPHLATPIITDPKRAAISLKWAVSEMERRYKYLAGWGVRNIDGYNAAVKERNEQGRFDEEGKPWKRMPYIVIIIDELADLMMVSGREVEESITRLAQMARAVGIHLVLATQRPSVDVITGLIKANFPSRISFRVSSKVDSRTIIDANGAERLLGKGDMLFLPPGTSQIIRIHGAFVEEKEIFKIVEHIKSQGVPEYDETITKTEEEMEGTELPGKTDPLFWEALRIVVNAKRASTSLLQRHLRIGYGRAAAILDAMVRAGFVGEMDSALRARPVLQAAFDALTEMEKTEGKDARF
ncbi:MAG: DNA translocase FtsK 4TM domain-containing protein [Pyrinomonadaceae bacterium]|nr:DNA translocase FtsK 4TM domain-containing protein [Pyrinomonadaceae bacterium]